MAKQCCVCGRKFSFMESGARMDIRFPDYELCMPCLEKYRDLESIKDEEKYEETFAHFAEFIASPQTPQELRDRLIKNREVVAERRKQIKEWHEAQELEEKRKEEQKRDYEQRLEQMLVVTCEHLDGYIVKKYLGAVSVDSLYFYSKSSKTVSSVMGSLSEVNDGAFKIGAVGGITSSMEALKIQVRNELEMKAAQMGANCILDLETDVAFFMPPAKEIGFMGTCWPDYVKISMSGTAVIAEEKK